MLRAPGSRCSRAMLLQLPLEVGGYLGLNATQLKGNKMKHSVPQSRRPPSGSHAGPWSGVAQVAQGTLPSARPTHIPPDALVDGLQKEGGEEAAEVHHQWDGGDELLLGQSGHRRVRSGSSGSGPRTPATRLAHLRQVEGVGEVHGHVCLGQVHNEPRAHVQRAYL